MSKIINTIKAPVLITLVMILLCGFIYPLILTGVSQLIFKDQANGSMITIDGKAVGSELIGQDFSDTRFMKCRPSAVNYNTYSQEDKNNGEYAGVSSGSKNYAATNSELVKRVEADIADFLRANPSVTREEIPTDLLTASGSGLDPHISPASAEIQIPALAISTGLSENRLREIVKDNTQGKFLGIFGEETVNVLMVNLQIAREIGIVK